MLLLLAHVPTFLLTGGLLAPPQAPTPPGPGGGKSIAACGADGEIPTRAEALTLLGSGATMEDFETFFLPAGPEILGVLRLDDTAVTNGQGPGLVEDGATYSDPSATQLQWNNDGWFSLNTQTMLSGGTTFRIDYDPPAQIIGIDTLGFSGHGHAGTVVIYDTAGVQIAAVPISITTGGAERDFVGWQHVSGISRIEVSSPAWPFSPVVDDHIYGDCLGDGNFCTSVANSTGGAAVMSASGTGSLSGPDLSLVATPVPNQPFLFFHGANQVQVPFGNGGFLCTSGGIVRSAPSTATGNLASITYDNDVDLVAFNGTQRNFQCWFRDPAAGGSNFNTSDGYAVEILP